METKKELQDARAVMNKIVMLNSDMSFGTEFPYVIKHGTKIHCPTCSAPGTKDDMKKHDKEAEFDDAVWWNTFEQHWECYDCWLK